MTTFRKVSLLGALVPLVGMLAAACSSSSAESAGPPALAGGYVSTSGGSILEIDFEDATHYQLWTTPCPTGGTAACASTGTYALNTAQDTLTLTDSTGAVTELPFQVETTAPAGTVQSVRPLNNPMPSDGGTDAAQLGGSGGSLYKPVGAIIEAFKVLERLPSALYATFARQTPTDVCKGQCFCMECGTGWSCNYCEGDGGCVINFPCNH